MRVFLELTCLLLIAGCGSNGEDTGDSHAAVQAGNEAAAKVEVAASWGAAISEGEFTPVSVILADPDAYVGKKVRIEGTAVAVCEHRGCWFNVASDVEGEVLRFKVEDGEMVFPMEIVGETMRGEGVFVANELDLETTKKICANEAEVAGKEFDPASVTTCRTVYQVTGTGAVQVAKSE